MLSTFNPTLPKAPLVEKVEQTKIKIIAL